MDILNLVIDQVIAIGEWIIENWIYIIFGLIAVLGYVIYTHFFGSYFN